MRPGSRTIRALVAIAGAGLLVPLLPSLALLLAAAVCAVLAFAALEYRSLLATALTVERPERVAWSLDEQEEYTVRVTTSVPFTLELEFVQRWPDLVEERSSVRQGACRAGEVLTFTLPLHAVKRGVAAVEPAAVAITRFRFAERIVEVGGAGEMAVTPNLAAVARLHRQLNSFFLRGYGNRTSARLGKGREFDRMRDYVRGDEMRDVSWKTTARHRRLIVREFRLDRSQDVLVCLDSGHRMAARVGHVTRLDHAVNASVLLSYVCNRMEDRIGVLSFASHVDRGVVSGRGMSHLREVTRYVTTVEPFYRHTDYLALAADIRRRVRHRSLIFMMTVLPELEDHHDLLRAVRMLAPQHVVVVTVFADVALHTASEILPADKRELSRMLVARDLWESRTALTRQLRGLGALVVDSAPEEFGPQAVNAYLEVKRRQLL